MNQLLINKSYLKVLNILYPQVFLLKPAQITVEMMEFIDDRLVAIFNQAQVIIDDDVTQVILSRKFSLSKSDILFIKQLLFLLKDKRLSKYIIQNYYSTKKELKNFK